MKSNKHNFWHWVFMFFWEEVKNLVWIGVGAVVFAGGYVLFKFSSLFFFKVAVGGPIALVGASIVLFKTYEVILVILSPFRLRVMCILCNNANE